MFILFDDVSVSVFQGKRQSAELCALPTIGTASEAIFRGIATSRITDTKGTMHKDLQLHLWHSLMDGRNLFDRQLPCQHYTTKAHLRKLLHLLDGTIVSLGGSVVERSS